MYIFIWEKYLYGLIISYKLYLKLLFYKLYNSILKYMLYFFFGYCLNYNVSVIIN